MAGKKRPRVPEPTFERMVQIHDYLDYLQLGRRRQLTQFEWDKAHVNVARIIAINRKRLTHPRNLGRFYTWRPPESEPRMVKVPRSYAPGGPGGRAKAG